MGIAAPAYCAGQVIVRHAVRLIQDGVLVHVLRVVGVRRSGGHGAVHVVHLDEDVGDGEVDVATAVRVQVETEVDGAVAVAVDAAGRGVGVSL